MENKRTNRLEYLIEGIQVSEVIKNALLHVTTPEEVDEILHIFSKGIQLEIQQNQLNHRKPNLFRYLEGELNLYKTKESEFLKIHLETWGKGFESSEFLYSLVAYFKSEEDKKNISIIKR